MGNLFVIAELVCDKIKNINKIGKIYEKIILFVARFANDYGSVREGSSR